jgi:signal transduction histidine kinase
MYCDSMFKYADLVKSPVWLSLCYRMRSKIEEASGDYKSSLANFIKYQKLSDSLNRVNYDKKVSVMNTFYELDKKQNQIDRLAKDEQISYARIERLTLAIVALILFSVLIILYTYNRRNKAEKLLKEKFAIQLLDSQEAERQRVAKDLHDSLGQNILFIKNQLQGPEINREKLLQSVALALEEVRSISKDLYPNQLEKYGLAAAVEALSEQVQASTGIFVSSDMQGIDEALNKNMQINLYRIIQEFFNNALKHAYATTIRITTEQTRNEIMLTLQDNGNGFSKEALSTIANKSFGLLNMEERVKILKGRFDIESEPGAGTKMTFTIPI